MRRLLKTTYPCRACGTAGCRVTSTRHASVAICDECAARQRHEIYGRYARSRALKLIGEVNEKGLPLPVFLEGWLRGLTYLLQAAAADSQLATRVDRKDGTAAVRRILRELSTTRDRLEELEHLVRTEFTPSVRGLGLVRGDGMGTPDPGPTALRLLSRDDDGELVERRDFASEPRT